MGAQELTGRCVVLGAAPVLMPDKIKSYIRQDDYIICADGGLRTAQRMGIRPDLLIGDFDSMEQPACRPAETITLPVCKDDTDMMAGIKEGITRGWKRFLLLGATGGRMDHTIANLCALDFLARQGMENWLADESNRATVVQQGILELRGMNGRLVSVFPFGAPSCLLSYEGLQYPLCKESLVSVEPRGVSNRAVSDLVRITVHQGPALVVLSDEN
ncbi:MAG TPA: thiamine diphosphokinase [Candidatus Gallacutalibacter stercoravium]|nr:thiamine diphosphokinase [Candidatus Gallacutalibacter stercoravium]